MKFNLGGVFMFISNLFIPVLMIIFGKIFSDYPPKTINGTYGYRTSMSKKNQDTWNFAHEYCGKLWWKIGWIMLLIYILIQLLFNSNASYILTFILIVQSIVLLGSILPVEKALKKNFDKDGNRR